MTRLLPLLLLFACGPEPVPWPEGNAGGTPVGLNPTELGGECRTYPSHTVGLLHCTEQAAPGYTLFAPLNSKKTYLIDNKGWAVHTWDSDWMPGESVYLEPNGHLLRTAEANLSTPFRAGGAGGRIQEFDWDGNLVWDFEYAEDTHLLHHDMERLPNGHVLMIAWESISQGQALALGRDPGLVDQDGMWANHLIEVNPATNEIVWEWHLLDHTVQDRDPKLPNYGVIADNPDRVDINLVWFAGGFGGSGQDWNHVNGVDYNAELDQIALSAHNQDEIWIIDHATGALIYRWGSPSNYGVKGPRQLSGQHDVEWIPEGSPGAGNLLIFNNGVQWGESSVVEIVPPLQPDGSYLRAPGEAWGPSAPVWSYSDGYAFFSSFISGSQRLPNGNTLICEGDNGRFFEVTPGGEIVWEYRNPVGPQGAVEQGFDFGGGGLLNAAFRADRYPPEYPAFDGRDLSPIGTIERN